MSLPDFVGITSDQSPSKALKQTKLSPAMTLWSSFAGYSIM